MFSSNVLNFETYIHDGLHVADLAREAGVTPATIRYYSRNGLLHAERNPDNDYRCFSPADVKRVRFIRKSQKLGLKIADIKSILERVENGEVPCGEVEKLVRERLHAICRQIEDLRYTKRRIIAAIREWEQNRGLMHAEANFCPLIENLDCEHQ